MPHVLVTDPVYVKDPIQFSINISDARPDQALSVRVPVSASLLKEIEETDALVQINKEVDETVYLFGKRRESLKEYKFLGWHVSESGMCCMVRDQVPEDSIDQLEFMISSLQNPLQQRDRDEFPHFLWFWRTPEQASSVRVYGCDFREESGEYEGLLLRQGREFEE